MIKYDELYKIVKEKISEKRFKHSEAVVKRAIEYAEIYNIDIATTKLVAIAHDIAKELTQDEVNQCIEKYNIELDDIEKVNKNLLHQKIGAYICKNEYGFTEDMFNAVRYHTTGRANMSILEKIIYLADATEETRKYNSSPYVEMVHKNINQAMVEVCKWVINKLQENNEIIHPDSLECYKYYENFK